MGPALSSFVSRRFSRETVFMTRCRPAGVLPPAQRDQQLPRQQAARIGPR